MNHQKHLKNLLEKFLLIGIKTSQQKEIFSGYMGNWIPEPEAPRVFQEIGLNFSGDEKQLYFQSYFLLRDDIQTEYLKDKELNERFYKMVLDVIEGRDKFKNQSELNNKIKEFLGKIIKPTEKYKVLFKIQNLDAKLEEEITFCDSIIARYDKETLIKWGFNQDGKNLFNFEDFQDQNVIIVEEDGNNVDEVVKRARVKANRRIRALQSYLKVEFIYDFQLLFEVSHEYAVRRESDTKLVSTGMNNENSPSKFDYLDLLTENAEKANKDYLLIKKFSPPMQDLLERVLYWIGLSISEIEMDLKIAFLCTALETLLTTKDDKRKGEKIAYRGYLLGEEIDSDGFYNQPHKILRVYELRSSVVHGSKFGITRKNDYWIMLEFTKHTFKNFITFASNNNLNKPTKIYKKLLKSAHIIPLMTWLNNFEDKPSESILESIKEDLFKKN